MGGAGGRTRAPPPAHRDEGLWGEERNPSDHGVAEMASRWEGIAGRGDDDLPPAIWAFLVSRWGSRESGRLVVFLGERLRPVAIGGHAALAKEVQRVNAPLMQPTHHVVQHCTWLPACFVSSPQLFPSTFLVAGFDRHVQISLLNFMIFANFTFKDHLI